MQALFGSGGVPLVPLQWWLLIVSALGFFGSYSGFFDLKTIQTRQFSNKKDEASALASRLFGAWTLVASLIRLHCALNIENATTYRLAIWTFAVALGFYVMEVFVHKTVPLKNALAPFVIASVSAVWMLVE